MTNTDRSTESVLALLTERGPPGRIRHVRDRPPEALEERWPEGSP